METLHYYHLFANGNDAKNFITTEYEFKLAFNRFGVCAHHTGATIVSGSIEDSHPHALLYGTYSDCCKYREMYETLSIKGIINRRGSLDEVNLHCELYQVNDEKYLLNVATYTINQATKDGKEIMPYDYLYGTGALYFRSKNTILPWCIDSNGQQLTTRKWGELTTREKRSITGSKKDLPDDWLICNGFILPTNYINIKRFENIFRTHNCFRVFLGNSKNQDQDIYMSMAKARGDIVDDLTARKYCEEIKTRLYGDVNIQSLSPENKLLLAQELRKEYCLSYRQLSTLTRLAEERLRKYVR